MIKKDKVLSKLTIPTHISYIAKYLMKTNKEEAKQKIDEYVRDGVLVESTMAKDYYVLK